MASKILSERIVSTETCQLPFKLAKRTRTTCFRKRCRWGSGRQAQSLCRCPWLAGKEQQWAHTRGAACWTPEWAPSRQDALGHFRLATWATPVTFASCSLFHLPTHFLQIRWGIISKQKRVCLQCAVWSGYHSRLMTSFITVLLGLLCDIARLKQVRALEICTLRIPEVQGSISVSVVDPQYY